MFTYGFFTKEDFQPGDFLSKVLFNRETEKSPSIGGLPWEIPLNAEKNPLWKVAPLGKLPRNNPLPTHRKIFPGKLPPKGTLCP